MTMTVWCAGCGERPARVRNSPDGAYVVFYECQECEVPNTPSPTTKLVLTPEDVTLLREIAIAVDGAWGTGRMDNPDTIRLNALADRIAARLASIARRTGGK